MVTNPRFLRRSLLALAFTALLGEVNASTFSSIPSLDAFVTTGPTGNLAASNFGGAGALSVAPASLSQGEFQSALQFNLAPAVTAFNAEFGAGNWTIQSVALQLTATSGNASFNTAAAGSIGYSWMQNDSWIEGTGTPASPSVTGITYNSLQNTFRSAGDEILGTATFTGGTSGNLIQALPLTSGFASDIASGGNVSIRIFAADGTASGVFNSRSFNTPANRPVLTVQAVPEPGTMALVSAALVAGLFFSRRARKR